ncbi:hypothetical protein RJ639_039966 [Escallonia herrerae]|uniref:CCHC-type domain-containing protein n=1 Tax=Escallonia herrerae TaxID=1293975 RepID=A0AA88WK76_9ASTE|nr:hypothetical protein RJ639_039966 [Escallonia herrerae]
MDWFSGNSGVLELAAINGPGVLDSALLRPGWFDTQSSDDDEEFDEEDVAMIAKNFKKFMRFRRNGGRRQQNGSNEEKLCYKCHKPGHMKMDCPIYKREKKERRDVWEIVKRRQLSKKENKEKEKNNEC